jgi:membrane fusion protein (multidrug efflux system)
MLTLEVTELIRLFRRHFFLAAALAVLVLMTVIGGLKLVAVSKDRSAANGAPSAARPASGPGGGALVSLAVIQPRAFSDDIEVLGVAKGKQSVTLTAATTQLVERVRFTDGQSVKRGAILVELRNTEQDAALAQAQAALVQADRAYQRYQKLAQEGWAAKSAVDQYEAAYRSALANVEAAKARQADRTIRAPFAGVVGLSDVTVGALVNPGAPIVTLDDLSSVRVDFQVPERFLAQIHEGQPLSATVDAYPGDTVTGRIAKLDTRVDERTRAITARAEFPNSEGRLKPGMMVRISVSRGQRQALSAPESGVAVEGDSAFVFVIQKNGARTFTEQRPVVTGVRQDGYVEITDGVRTGEQIVADGLSKLQGGQAIRVAARPAADPADAAPPATGARPAA